VIVPALLVAGVTFRRLAAVRSLVLAVSGGLLAGLAVLGLPSPALVEDVFVALVAGFSALIVLPVVAGLPTGDRRGGYEQLQGVRPLSSLAWAVGRMQGSFVAGVLMLLIVSWVGNAVAGTREMPRVLSGVAQPGDSSLAQWRFAMPVGVAGPYELEVQTYLPFAGSGELVVTTRRADAEHTQSVAILPVRRHTVSIPDLAPARGDLYVSLEARSGVVLAAAIPTLVVGTDPQGLERINVPSTVLSRLAFALLVVLSAAQAFRFETACLAGVFALAVTPPDSRMAWVTAVLLALVFTTFAVTLVRRQAMP